MQPGGIQQYIGYTEVQCARYKAAGYTAVGSAARPRDHLTSPGWGATWVGGGGGVTSDYAPTQCLVAMVQLSIKQLIVILTHAVTYHNSE